MHHLAAAAAAAVLAKSTQPRALSCYPCNHLLLQTRRSPAEEDSADEGDYDKENFATPRAPRKRPSNDSARTSKKQKASFTGVYAERSTGFPAPHACAESYNALAQSLTALACAIPRVVQPHVLLPAACAAASCLPSTERAGRDMLVSLTRSALLTRSAGVNWVGSICDCVIFVGSQVLPLPSGAFALQYLVHAGARYLHARTLSPPPCPSLTGSSPAETTFLESECLLSRLVTLFYHCALAVDRLLTEMHPGYLLKMWLDGCLTAGFENATWSCAPTDRLLHVGSTMVVKSAPS